MSGRHYRLLRSYPQVDNSPSPSPVQDSGPQRLYRTPLLPCTKRTLLAVHEPQVLFHGIILWVQRGGRPFLTVAVIHHPSKHLLAVAF